ncbi:MAG: cellulase family glycosylhydrolase [Cyclobacteriaceae bacterium]|nr:cellulase family glycosylhydrolase [Cyclobacteriaceae bacterium]
MKYLLPFLVLGGLLWSCQPKPVDKTGFVVVKGVGFEIDGKPYHYLGTNFWYGLNLGSKGPGGNRDRLLRELDRLAGLGVMNLRVMAGSEGPDDEPYRMLPSLQTAPGEYNADVLEGLDFLLDEMKKRDMKAVMCLNNFWNWSGGMAQYLVWAGAADSIPYPPPHPGGDWSKYQEFTASFYSNAKAVELFNRHIEFMLKRKNSLSGLPYKNDPTIMSWELANEPRGVNNQKDFRAWLEAVTALIRMHDPNHLITTGSEGKTSAESSGTDLALDHASKNIDYSTIHIWVQNWNYFDPMKATETYEPALAYAKKYLSDHVAIARTMGKPVVLEEFGISRDLNSYEASSAVTWRDQYYQSMFAEVTKLAQEPESPLAGCNFWAWGGEGRPRQPGGLWKTGDAFVGDPPHEMQGWYSVYETDTTTQSVIRQYAATLSELK